MPANRTQSPRLSGVHDGVGQHAWRSSRCGVQQLRLLELEELPDLCLCDQEEHQRQHDDSCQPSLEAMPNLLRRQQLELHLAARGWKLLDRDEGHLVLQHVESRWRFKRPGPYDYTYRKSEVS